MGQIEVLHILYSRAEIGTPDTLEQIETPRTLGQIDVTHTYVLEQIEIPRTHWDRQWAQKFIRIKSLTAFWYRRSYYVPGNGFQSLICMSKYYSMLQC